MTDHYLSLYFASIDARRSAALLLAWITAPFASTVKRRASLARAVRSQLGDCEVFAYASARGALASCLRALGIRAGDVVLLSSFTCLAVPTAVLAIGARPEYVDIDSSSLNTPAQSVIAALHPKVKAIVLQHTLGRIAEVEAIVAVARARGIVVIEDCALSVGSSRQGCAVGTVGDAAIFSMELSKTISSGWGGVLAVREQGLARRIAEDFARVAELPAFETARRILQIAVCGICYHPSIFRVGRYVVAAGFRVRLFKPSTSTAETYGKLDGRFIAKLGGAQTVLATAQWLRLSEVASRCAFHAQRLRSALRAARLRVVAEPGKDEVAVAPRVAFLVRDRTTAMRWFEARGVELGAWFDGPLSPLPDPDVFNYVADHYPSATAVAEQIVNLPSHNRLSSSDVDRLIALVESYAAEHPLDREPFAQSSVLY